MVDQLEKMVGTNTLAYFSAASATKTKVCHKGANVIERNLPVIYRFL
jgi:hypothetical protein